MERDRELEKVSLRDAAELLNALYDWESTRVKGIDLGVPGAVGWAKWRQLRAAMAEEKADAGTVAERVSNVIGDMLAGRTTRQQNTELGKVAERANRVNSGSDAAVGKAIGG